MSQYESTPAPADAQHAAPPSIPRPRGQRGPRVRACESTRSMRAFDSMLTWSSGAECKRHKIRCEVRRGEGACVRCLRSGIACLPHDPQQRMMDENEA